MATGLPAPDCIRLASQDFSVAVIPEMALCCSRTRCRLCEMRFGRVGGLRQDHGLCLSVRCIDHDPGFWWGEDWVHLYDENGDLFSCQLGGPMRRCWIRSW